jgi:DNA repair protein RadC
MNLCEASPSLPPSGPRERAFEEGVAALGDADLLAILLGTGLAGRPVTVMAAALLDRFSGIEGVARVGPSALAEHPGVGRAKALRVLAGLELGRRTFRRPLHLLGPVQSSAQVAAHMAPRLAALDHEEMWLLSLDAGNRARSIRRVAQGGLHSAAVKPRDVLRVAIADAATSMLLVHNHPGGDPEPSPHDFDMTRMIVEAGAAVDLPLIDHVVVTPGSRYSSMLDLGIIPRAR